MWAAMLPNVSSTGRGARVVPEVWTTSATSSSSGSRDAERRAAVLGERVLTTTSAPRRSSLRSRSPSRGSTGMRRRAQQQAGVEGDDEVAARPGA